MRHAVRAIAVTAIMAATSPVRAQEPPASPLDKVPDKMPFDVPYGEPIALDRAQAVIAAVMAECQLHGWKINVAVADSGANLVAFARMDGAQLSSIAVSEHKARTAAMSRRETKMFEATVNGGTVSILTLDGIIAARGGIPLIKDGKLIGAVGVSGGTGSQDEVCAKAGVAALGR